LKNLTLYKQQKACHFYRSDKMADRFLKKLVQFEKLVVI